ncbi:hypothetical protein SD70_23695 [Gordoniibacillus kamchatkensis]|uniref:Type II secretion system protein GspF domain-containing protein n=1 Tax=Gordoniibacillus kamchatkensis TaxID=1590651 RepID=A0ABR5ACX3_9BACL|nr:hypothetical protein SD70_23695 [Paenibacillus sp. VKM B-2647]
MAVHGSWGLIGVTGYLAVVSLFRALPQRAVRWKPWQTPRLSWSGRFAKTVAKLLLVPREEGKLEGKRQLLLGAGIGLHPEFYEIVRRSCMFLSGTLVLWGIAGMHYSSFARFIEPAYAISVGSSFLLLLAADRKVLEQLKLRRSHQIVKEIYVLSSQLLYYTGSKMNLHYKLMRCVPPTRIIRGALQRMLAEWYQDAELAIRDFQRRLGTDEARSFAETLQALRLHEHGSYYELLRERIRDYKEKLELAKESRKETVSYILFVLAGLPILNTFRVFMYPWIMEGQKLFQSLN